MAINEAQEDHELLGTARALRSDQKVKVKAVTETSTHYQGAGTGREGTGGRLPWRNAWKILNFNSALPFRFCACRHSILSKRKTVCCTRKKKEKLWRINQRTHPTSIHRVWLDMMCRSLHVRRKGQGVCLSRKRNVRKESGIFWPLDHRECSRFATPAAII